jgi:hypothetical protein
VLHWSVQRHPGGGDNLPGIARLQYAELGHTPGSTATTQDLCDSDARPGGTCTRGATAYVHRAGPETQCHSLQQRQQARRKTTCALQRQTIQRGPAQQHLLQWRQPAQQTIDTANHRPAQQRPCGRDNRPGELHLSKSTPPLCSPLCRYGPNNSAVDNNQTSRSNNGVHELLTIFGSLKGRLR